MKPFHTIATPHRDILESRLAMDVFAADLWDVHNNRGSEEYRDAETFFAKTYMTEGLTNLLGVVEKRLLGGGGDAVINIQTPFGGGKTHALIAMYHKAKEWKAERAVIVGTKPDPVKQTLWGMLEDQLLGRVSAFTGMTAPGGDAIRELLEASQPVIILMDELLEYITKAAGITVGDSTLAAQSMAFMQELTETVRTLEKVALVVSLPKSVWEHFDNAAAEAADRLLPQLQHVTARLEKIYTTVNDNEITLIIRQRLFGSIDEAEAKKTVTEYVKYAENEEILPAGTEPSEYRKRFMASYPFLPEVVDVLYRNWGTFPSFQRTRGVLRLLSLVVHSRKDSQRPYLSLADFELADQELRQELLKYAGQTYNGIIGGDITDSGAGAKRIDQDIGKSYTGLKLGSRTATTIFMYSFSGGQQHGTTLNEIKRNASNIGTPASIISEVVDQLRNRLFYMQASGDRYYFNNMPNINQVLQTKLENVSDEDILDQEKDLIKRCVAGRSPFKLYVWEDTPSNITDTEDLKLVILPKNDPDLMRMIVEQKGQTTRVNRNTIIFLYPLDTDRGVFHKNLKRRIAYGNILKDHSLNLADEQKKDVQERINKLDRDLSESVLRTYRLYAVPARDGVRQADMGMPSVGGIKEVDMRLYDSLRKDREIIEEIAPIVIKEKFLSGRDFVSTEQLYQSFLKTPGSPRLIDRRALQTGINEGVKAGMFGLGELDDDAPVSRYYREYATVSFTETEVIIAEAVCLEQMKEDEEPSGKDSGGIAPQPGPTEQPDTGVKPPEKPRPGQIAKNRLRIRFKVPKGKVANLIQVLNYLLSKFDTVQVDLGASEGEITVQEFEEKVQEAFDQMGIELEVMEL